MDSLLRWENRVNQKILQKFMVPSETYTRNLSEVPNQMIGQGNRATLALNSGIRISRLNKGGGRVCDFSILAFSASKKAQRSSWRDTITRKNSVAPKKGSYTLAKKDITAPNYYKEFCLGYY